MGSVTHLLLFIVAVFALSYVPLARAATPNQRAVALLAQMSLEQKYHMIRGTYYLDNLLGYTGNIVGISSLNIPNVNLQDGPQGVGDSATGVTCWPSALTAASTWDTDLMYAFGQGTANEERGKGVNVHLSPIVNIARVPYSGRTYEYFGEDPTLNAKMGVAAINGIQSQGVIAVVKHFANYNQETNRNTVSANVDERTQWEIYYPAFQAAVNAGVGSVMCSYNLINNTHACENDQTIQNDLKQTMGFQGWVMSDWFGTHSTVASANNGLDMEMPLGLYFSDVTLGVEVLLGAVHVSRINDMVTRILTSMFTAGLFDVAQTGSLSTNVSTEAHAILSRQIAAAGTVLLKNTGNLLPLSANLGRIAVIGDDGNDSPVIAGQGSGAVIPPYIVTPLNGIRSRAPNAVITYANSDSLTTAAAGAQAADVAIVFVSIEEAEGTDRANLSLSGNQDALIAAVAAVQPNTIVVLHVPGPTLMPWIASVPSVLSAFYPGQEDGNAIASVLFGDVNPSGRLTMTFPPSETEQPINTPIQYPGVNLQTNYTEKLLVGYRWFDAQNVAPLFPFGHGLSYTTFGYSNLVVTSNATGYYTITFSVQNTGTVAGAEVTQLYVGFPAAAGEPPKVLRDFQKVQLSPSATTSVQFSLVPLDLSIWDITVHNWKLAVGSGLTFYVGASSRDIRLTQVLP